MRKKSSCLVKEHILAVPQHRTSREEEQKSRKRWSSAWFHPDLEWLGHLERAPKCKAAKQIDIYEYLFEKKTPKWLGQRYMNSPDAWNG